MMPIASCLKFATAALCLMTSCAFAGDIYKWTDENGNVHYEDRPIAGSQRVDIASQPSNPDAIRERRSKLQAAPAEAPVDEAAPAAETPPLTRAERARQRQERAEQCADARERLQRHAVARRMYRVDENGERVYLDDAEIEAARDRAEQKVAEYCAS